jgi:hypothetical protein
MRALALMATALGFCLASTADAGALRRPADAMSAGVPLNVGTIATGTGMEAPAYAHGYAFALPADGNWRWIEPRCREVQGGVACVEGHWVRRVPGRCEEVSAHAIRRGGYIRFVPAGPVSGCRN